MKWKCRDGREIELSEMSDSHLTNALAMCKRNLTDACDEQHDHIQAINDVFDIGDGLWWHDSDAFCRRISMLLGWVQMFQEELGRRLT